MEKKIRIISAISLAALLLISVICILSVSSNSHRATYAVPMPQQIIGEYSYNGTDWYEITEDTRLSAYDGDLTIRGHFVRDLPEGKLLSFYRNHIGVSMYINGERVYMDAVTETQGKMVKLFASMCGQEWSSIYSRGITTEDEIEIHLFNPHKFGNKEAYNDFLSTICGNELRSVELSKNLEPYGKTSRTIGTVLIIASFMLMGAVVASIITKFSLGGVLLKFGMMIFFAGGFIVLDAIDIIFVNDILVFNTYGKQICLMLSILFLGLFNCTGLSGKLRIGGELIMLLSAIINIVLIILSFTGVMVIYDTFPYWFASQLLIIPGIVTLNMMETIGKKNRGNIIPVSSSIIYIAVIVDITLFNANIIHRSSITKAVLLIFFAVHVIIAVKRLVQDHRNAGRAVKLEKELEDSRVAIMLSQIQPHFLYNVLGTIRGLCREDPEKAWSALGDFSSYLRGNMIALTSKNDIHFTSELRHIETYLRLEKMRMGDKLNILYDIQEKDFFIPPLTVQPLVENAVKHGLFEKNGSGTLIIHSSREGDNILISVQDDGVGFDLNAPKTPGDNRSERPHIGIANVRSRLGALSGGRLMVESTPGKGTTATVVIKVNTINEEGEQ